MSSLAAQLSNIASIDASRLTSRTGAPSGQSYLFPPKTAASHDIDAIFALAQSGYEELLELDPGFEEFEDSLFSEHARRTDRTLLNEAENKELDVVLGRCLRRLGRWIGIMAGGKCIEWLVRRFRYVRYPTIPYGDLAKQPQSPRDERRNRPPGLFTISSIPQLPSNAINPHHPKEIAILCSIRSTDQERSATASIIHHPIGLAFA